MGNQIIKQPNGLFAVFSTNTGTVVVWDASEEEIVRWFVDLAAADAERAVRRVLDCVSADEPRKVYHQFAMTWDEALKRDRESGGDASRYEHTPQPDQGKDGPTA